MVIQIRGTSGSGKSTAMRRVMDMLGDWNAVKVPERKQPLYYRSDEFPSVFVLGHYESPCGGGDTIGSAPAIYALVKTLDLDPFGETVVLVEGLLLSEDSKWTPKMPNVHVFFLTTPVDRCVEQIKKRRAEVGNDKPLKEGNTRNRVAVIERARVKLEGAGVPCRRCSADQAPGLVLRMLRLHAGLGVDDGSRTVMGDAADGR